MPLTSKKNKEIQNEQRPVKRFKNENEVNYTFFIGRNLSPEEVALVLPSSFTFDIEDIDINALSLLQKFGSFDKKESLFFMKMAQSTDLEEVEIYKQLMNLLKGDRQKKRKSVKKLLKVENYDLTLEKIILFLISQDLDTNCKEKILTVIEMIHVKYKGNIKNWVEIVFLVTFFLDDLLLKSKAFEILSNFLIYNTNKIESLIFQEIDSEDKNIQEIISRLLSVYTITNGYNTTLDTFIKSRNSILIFLKSHYFIFKYFDIEIMDFRKDMFKFLDEIIKIKGIKLRKEISNIISYFNLKNFLDEQDCQKWLQVFLNIIYDYLGLEKNFEKIKIPDLNQEKNYLMNLLRTCSILSINSQNSSNIIFDFLKIWPDFTINNIKIFYRISENLNYSDVEFFITKNFDQLIDSKFVDYKKMIISIFQLILPNKKIEDLLISRMLDNEFILEIFNNVENIAIENRSQFIENLFLLIKNNSIFAINNIESLSKIVNFKEEAWYNIFEIGKSKIGNKNEDIKILGFKLINKIIKKIDKNDIKKFAQILYEKLDKNDKNLLIYQINTLDKIYEIYPLNDTSDKILEMATFLKYKDDNVKYACISFISTILKSKNHQNISKIEFMRIAYDVMDYLSFWYDKKKECGIILLTQISDIVAPQEIINIFLEFLEFNDKNIKKGLILGISHLANHVGIYNVLPVLLTDYKYVEDKVKLIIIRVLIKCKMEKKYIPYLTSIIEDSILNPVIDFRVEGVELCTELLINLDKSEMDVEILTHHLNLIWYNILETNTIIIKEFNKFIKNFTKTLGAQFLIKYVIQGMFHPSKKVRRRYNEIYEIIKLVDKNVTEYLEIIKKEINCKNFFKK
ncbi:splicing factor 3B subunit 1 [Vairimorpha necatrix]|uniref:Splicing factor 3B subunit 1 n=1 Tax=Vairimorpha necatrix TaxID=6039 RepID=A0AAX4J8L0_9MICR